MILISACLVGLNCKYSGDNNYDEKCFNLVKENKAIPVCAEQLGGLPTPRNPSEIKVVDGKRKVFSNKGVDVTFEYEKGAEEILNLAKRLDIKEAVLQPRSPSCGKGKIYDGTFSKTLIDDNGILADLLIKNGIKVYTPEEYFKL